VLVCSLSIEIISKQLFDRSELASEDTHEVGIPVCYEPVVQEQPSDVLELETQQVVLVFPVDIVFVLRLARESTRNIYIRNWV
jgi:hypothetical protein